MCFSHFQCHIDHISHPDIDFRQIHNFCHFCQFWPKMGVEYSTVGRGRYGWNIENPRLGSWKYGFEGHFPYRTRYFSMKIGWDRNWWKSIFDFWIWAYSPYKLLDRPQNMPSPRARKTEIWFSKIDFLKLKFWCYRSILNGLFI